MAEDDVIKKDGHFLSCDSLCFTSFLNYYMLPVGLVEYVIENFHQSIMDGFTILR